MESLVVFVIIAAINIIAKSAQDKRKIEKAKARKAKQLKNNPIPNRVDQGQRRAPLAEKKRINYDERETLKENREKEYANRKNEQLNYNSRKYNSSTQSSNRESYAERVEKENALRLVRERKELLAEQLEAQDEIKKGLKKNGFERKKLINAVIWSEILKEPKSIQNIRKEKSV